MTPSRHSLLDEALDMTRRMSACAAVDDWDTVIALEPRRRELLEQAFATHAPVDELVTDRVRAILDLDRDLMENSIRARDSIAEELGKSSKGRKATSAYHAARG